MGRAREIAEERVLDILLPGSEKSSPISIFDAHSYNEQQDGAPGKEGEQRDASHATREKLRKMLVEGKLDSRPIEIESADRSMPVVEIFSSSGIEELGINFKDMLGSLMPKGSSKKRRMTVKEALEFFTQQEAQDLVDMEKVVKDAIALVENSGIIFIDEIDKIAGRESGHGPDVSREGVQRDLLPIVEGSTVNTKYGPVKTDHILFIASGAFSMSKPSDLIPELQGRFPIRVELDPLGRNEFVRILTEPKNALLLQYKELLKTEGVEIEFTPEAVEEIALAAEEVNERTENIGARRLHTMMEHLLEDLLFDAPDRSGERVVIDREFVVERLSGIKKDVDLSRYIL